MLVKILGRLTPGIAVAMLLWSASDASATGPILEHVGSIQIRYQQNKRKNAPVPSRYFGKYWGSGNGRITGQINGNVHWDLYEDQSRDDMHRAILVGVVITEDEQRIPFETIGMYKPREGGFWDLTAAVNLDCKDTGCGGLNSRRLLWLGTVKWGEWTHRAELYVVNARSLSRLTAISPAIY